MVYSGDVVHCGSGAARSVGDLRRAFQLTRVPGVGNAKARAGDGVAECVGGFCSGLGHRNAACLSVARAAQALQVHQCILRPRIARQRVPGRLAGRSDGI